MTSDTARDEYTPSGGDSTPEDRDKTTATEYEHVMKEAEQERPEQETTTWESFGGRWALKERWESFGGRRH